MYLLYLLTALPDRCIFFWSFGGATLMKSMFRPTFGWGGATKTRGEVRTAGHLMKWGYLLHYRPETCTVSCVIKNVKQNLQNSSLSLFFITPFKVNQKTGFRVYIWVKYFVSEASGNTFSVFLIGQMVVAKVLSRLYTDMLLYGQSIVYYEHCVSVSRELKDKRLEGEYLEILSSLYLSLNTEK